jgi:hypothetical protein
MTATKPQPKRIQRKRTKGWRMPSNTVYVGRPTVWGNPNKIGEKIPDDCVPNGYTVIDAVTCLELFERHCEFELMDNSRWLEPLRGKDLACWCSILDKNGAYVHCHADVLLSLANNASIQEVIDENIRQFREGQKGASGEV